MASVLRELRDQVPLRPLSQTETFRVAELQANRLLELVGVEQPPVRLTFIQDLPHIQVEVARQAFASGASHWSHGRWLILLAESESLARRRFTLAHEFKHILDNPFIARLYLDANGVPSHDRAEQVCNYFAACLLMPRAWLQRFYVDDGVHEIKALARIFAVSPAAMQFRLVQLGLTTWGQPVQDALFESLDLHVGDYFANCRH